MTPEEADQKFTEHQQKCERCRTTPLNLCKVGNRFLRACAPELVLYHFQGKRYLQQAAKAGPQ